MAVSEELLVRIRGDLSDVQAKLGQLDNRVNRSASNAQSRFQAMGRALTAAFAGVATIAAVRGFANLASASLEASANIQDMADRAGVGVEFLQEMRDAATFSGASVRDFDDAISRLNRRLGLFMQSGGGPAAQAFEDLGLAGRIASGELRDAEGVFNAAVEALEGVEGQARRSALASQLFGEDSGPRLVQLLSRGVEGINEYRQAARDAGRVVSEDLVASAADANDALQRMGIEIRTRLNAAIAANSQGLVQFAELLGTIAVRAIETADRIGRFADAIGNIFAQGQRNPQSAQAIRREIERIDELILNMQTRRSTGRGGIMAMGDIRAAVGDMTTRQFEEMGVFSSEGLDFIIGRLNARIGQLGVQLRDVRGDMVTTGQTMTIELGGGAGEAAAEVQDLTSFLDELSASLEALPANVGNFEEQNKAKLESLAEAAVVAGEEFRQFAYSAEDAAGSVTGAIGSAFERMAMGIRVTFQDLARDILAIMARVAFNNLIAAPLTNFLGNAFSSIPGLGTAGSAPAIAAGPATAGGAMSVVNIDARGATPGVEEKIREVLRQEMPGYQRQAAGLAVSSISAIQRKRSIG